MQNDQIVGYEFLLRSDHCNNPEKLFHCAKMENQLTSLDMKSIETIFQKIERNYSHLVNVNWFINVFPSTLADPIFMEHAQKWIDHYNVEPKTIVFEINEGLKETDFSALTKTVRELKKLGFLIALDDIGKGEATIKSIIELDPNILKFDRYLSNNLSTSRIKQSVIRHFVKAFHKQKWFVLEGIENKADFETVKQLGVPYGQGYYLGRPQDIAFYL